VQQQEDKVRSFLCKGVSLIMVCIKFVTWIWVVSSVSVVCFIILFYLQRDRCDEFAEIGKQVMQTEIGSHTHQITSLHSNLTPICLCFN